MRTHECQRFIFFYTLLHIVENLGSVQFSTTLELVLVDKKMNCMGVDKVLGNKRIKPIVVFSLILIYIFMYVTHHLTTMKIRMQSFFFFIKYSMCLRYKILVF